MIKENPKIPLLILALSLCLLVLILDLIGVKVLQRNGLAFNVHCYSYGITFIAASTAIAWLYWLSSGKTKLIIQIVKSAILGAVWWVISLSHFYIFKE